MTKTTKNRMCVQWLLIIKKNWSGAKEAIPSGRKLDTPLAVVLKHCMWLTMRNQKLGREMVLVSEITFKCIFYYVYNMDISNLLQKHGKGGKDITSSKWKGTYQLIDYDWLRLITLDLKEWEIWIERLIEHNRQKCVCRALNCIALG